MKRVLIVDDEAAVVDPVEFALRRAGFEVCVADTLGSGQHELARAKPDLLILDIGLPDGDGLTWCEELRTESQLPILLLTAHADEADRIRGLELGADDYVTKPFSVREVVARVKTILRRTNDDADRAIEVGALAMNVQAHRVSCRGVGVSLTRTEFDLLRTLLTSPDRVFTREVLMERAYDGVYVSGRTIDSHIKGIRKKFIDSTREDPIETIRGVGYRARKIEVAP